MGFFSSFKALFQGSESGASVNPEAYELLDSLRARRTPVCVKLAGQKFSTYILSVKRTNGDRALELDELMPLEGNDIAARTGKLRFEVRGVDAAKFDVKITAFEGGIYYCRIPNRIQVTSQRKSKRVPLTQLGKFPVEIYSEGRKMVKGQLSDASEHGLQIEVRLSERVIPPFERGEIIHELHLVPASDLRIQFSIELRRVQINQSRQRIYVGASIRHFKSTEDEKNYKTWLLRVYRNTKD